VTRPRPSALVGAGAVSLEHTGRRRRDANARGDDRRDGVERRRAFSALSAIPGSLPSPRYTLICVPRVRRTGAVLDPNRAPSRIGRSDHAAGLIIDGLAAHTLRLPAALTAIALAGSIVSAVAMQGMGSMDGPRSMGSFLWLWIAMSAAMMLPSLVPAASLASTVGSSGTAFVGGYVMVWTVAGVVAFEAARGLMDNGRWLAVGAIVAAALYKLSPLKGECLRRCRSPLGLLFRRSPFAPVSSTASSASAAAVPSCSHCSPLVSGACFGWQRSPQLFIEKVTSFGTRASVPVAVALLGAAVWIAV